MGNGDIIKRHQNMEQKVHEKQCSKCKEVKPTSDFNKGKHPDGLRTECRVCQSKHTYSYKQKRKPRMRLSRHQQIVQGLSPQEKKIYDCVPATPTPRKLIAAAVDAQIGLRDQRLIFGCLNALTEKGLLAEPVDGTFRRVAVSAPLKLPPTPTPTPMPELTTEPETTATAHHKTEETPKEKTMTPLEKMAAIAQQAAELQDNCKKLVSAIETTALEIEQLFSDRDAESKKLQELKNILKSLG